MVNSNKDFLIKGHSEGFIDIHCHCLPDLDDGPSTIDEAILLCQLLVEEDVVVAVATPHQLGRYEFYNEAAIIREAVCKINGILEKKNVAISVVPGAEVRIDERICKLLEVDKILTIADGGKYILLELPHQIFVDIEPLLKELSDMNIRPIISHVERIIPPIQFDCLLQRWFEYSVILQITASSLIGIFGSEIKNNAWEYLKSGMVSIVATDSHDCNKRRPYIKAAFELIKNVLGEGLAHSVCVGNPLRILNGQDVIPVSTYCHREVLR